MSTPHRSARPSPTSTAPTADRNDDAHLDSHSHPTHSHPHAPTPTPAPTPPTPPAPARRRPGRDDRGQATAEYGLVILVAGLIALGVIAWVRGTGVFTGLFESVIDTLTSAV